MARRLNKIRATVELQVTVDEHGHVTDAKPVGAAMGFGFEKEAVRVARGSVFKPATHDGVPVAFDTRMTISFQHQR